MLVLKGSADDQVDVIVGVLNRHVQGGGGGQAPEPFSKWSKSAPLRQIAMICGQ